MATQNWIDLGNLLVKRHYEVIFIGGTMEEGMIRPYLNKLDTRIKTLLASIL